MPDTHSPEDKEVFEQPRLETKSSGERCRFCMGGDFRRVRMDINDMLTLLKMRVPARCVRCGQLQTIGFATAWRAAPPSTKNTPTVGVPAPRAFPAGTPIPAKAAQQVAVPVPVAKVAAPVAPVAPAAPVVQDHPSREREHQLNSRAAISQALLDDPLDIRCQFCPGQTFRRSRLRLQDIVLILRMRYSVRCLRCGQRQTVSFMVAASGVPSSFKQPRALRNTETWGQFTANSAPQLPKMTVVNRPIVFGQEYMLKDMPPAIVYDEPVVERAAPVSTPEPEAEKPAPAAKKPAGDQSIW